MSLSEEKQQILITSNLTIREALQRLCISSKRVLFVTEGTVFKGTLNDGDIRRYLLKNGKLDDPVSAAANYHAKFLFTTERGKARCFLWENNINAVPIVDEDMNIEDIVFLHESVDLDKVSIRQLKNDDLSMVLEFFDQMAGDTRAMFNRGDVNRIRVIEHLGRQHDDNQIHFAAVVKNDDGTEKMVGYVFLWDTHTLVPWLGICIREDWKGNHLGRILLEFLDKYAKEQSYGGLMLTTVPANVRAHSLYTRMGFEYFGVYPDSEFLYIKRFKKN